MIYLVRHGETEWSVERRHTGRTDVPLTERGRAEAAALAPVLGKLHADRVLTSPLSRARDTCALAGFGDRAEVDDRLVEWDYGQAEGRTTAEIRVDDPAWSIWTHPMAGAEALESVATRVDQVIAGLGDPQQVTLIFAHAHLLRILGARWCGQPALFGSNLVLDPASVSVLSFEREVPVIERWNVVADAIS
ncbi:histidine phosphatase family protein [Aquihabitans sp. McL0605]|uniref:histidine phosphatase family protein n=1 Tax=Aquihabitans sp. McL0605 TaxID=3415671 RepID=UPI003CF632F6